MEKAIVGHNDNADRQRDPETKGGCGSPVVKEGIGSWQACHEFEPSTTKDERERCMLNLSRAQTSSPPRHLTMVQNDEVRRQKPSWWTLSRLRLTGGPQKTFWGDCHHVKP
ncbi:hypothetical protein TNCV_4520901 [Trichonephila clavipes]|nr:hypothetical protein TNCV_4520901 [Trichonephila clavipes]